MLEGSCLCGNVKWSYSPALESVTACNCNLCRRYGALWAYGFLNEGIQVSGATSVYTRHRKLSGFHFCTVCGCLAYYLALSPDQNDQRKIAVNVRMISDVQSVAHLPIDHFDGKDSFEDLPRDGRTVADLWF